MTDPYRARGLITAKSARIETLLRALGGEGIGLKELRMSVSEKLAEPVQGQIRKVNSVRNQAAHEDHFQITDQALREFAANADDLIFQLEALLAEAVEPDLTHTVREVVQSKPEADEAETAAQYSQALEDERIRNRKFADIENRRLATQMDTKSVIRARSGMSEETKEKVKEQAMKVGLAVLVSMFKK